MSLCYIQRAKRNIFILLLLYATRNILDVSCFENISTTVVAALLLKYSMQSIVVLADTDRDAILPKYVKETVFGSLFTKEPKVFG